MRPYFILSCLSLSLSLFAEQPAKKEETSKPSTLRIVPVMPTPESNNVTVGIMQPQNREIAEKNPVPIQVLLSGFPLGTNSDFPRAEQLRVNSIGQTLNFIIDDQPPFSVGDEVLNVFDGSENYFEDLITVTVPWALEKGEHLLRIFPARSFDEGLKGEGAFVSRIFYFQEQGSPVYDLKAPFITYNQPYGKFKYARGAPILLDFYVVNCELSSDGYKVKLSIDDRSEKVISLWVPYYIYGLPVGTHKVRLELLDQNGAVVSGKLTSVERVIEITP